MISLCDNGSSGIFLLTFTEEHPVRVWRTAEWAARVSSVEAYLKLGVGRDR